MDYVHVPDLAPTQEMLDEYKKLGGDWSSYESRFLALMRERRIEERIPREVIAEGCLLCSEDKPHHCHRRLVAEYLKEYWGDLEISHLAGTIQAGRGSAAPPLLMTPLAMRRIGSSA